MNNEDMAGRIMAHAFHDELEKVALRKVIKKRMRYLTSGYRHPSYKKDRLTILNADTAEELARAKSHESGRRAARFFRKGETKRARRLIEQGKLHKSIARNLRKMRLEKTSSSQILRGFTSAAGRSVSRGSRLPAPKVNLPKGKSYGDLFGDAPRPKVPAVKKKPSSMYNFGDYPAGTPGLVRPK